MKKLQKKLFVFTFFLAFSILNISAENDPTPTTTETTNNDTKQTSPKESEDEDELDPTIGPFSMYWILEILGLSETND